MSGIHLNHCYIVIDPAAYQAIVQSAFLRRRFAAVELRTTVRRDTSYTGLYFYGTHTYFEFFDASDSQVSKQFAGDGIAFGVDSSRVLPVIKDKLAPEFQSESELITRQYEGRHVPWFTSLKLKGLSSQPAPAVWFMEYQPGFLKAWNPQTAAPNRGVSRKAILQRYISVLQDVPDRPLFEDLVSVTIAAQETTRRRLNRLIALLDLGADIEFNLTPSTGGREGIQALTMRVRGRPDNGQTEFRFGQGSTLRFHADHLATWTFR